MAYRFDASKPVGRRIAGVTVGDAPLDPARTYRLATNNFLGRGGDGYAMFAPAPRIIDKNAGALMTAQVIAAIEAAVRSRRASKADRPARLIGTPWNHSRGSPRAPGRGERPSAGPGLTPSPRVG